jgi:hypothetical protein
MKKVRDISEDEMIATFLKGEINSSRFGHHIHERLERDDKGRDIIDDPDLNNSTDNEYRKNILKEYRGFGDNKHLFEGFPDNIKWERVVLPKDDLKRIKYIDYDYWIELSQGTRYVKDAVSTIKQGKEIYKVSNQGFLDAAEAVRKGTIFPDVILVSTGKMGDLVVIEGHARLTAYLLAIDKMPNEIEAIVGYSTDIVNWGLY